MEEIIRTEKISKKYSGVLAVDSVSLNVKKGEIYGFLGLNGAGKTTTIRMLLGMIKPASGGAYIKGIKVDAGKYGIWKDVGYMVEMPYAYPELTVRENLEMFSSLRGLKGKESVDTVIEKLRLVEYADRKSKNLSLGNAQRLGLAKALIHNPEILILDEPANGLDPAGIVEIRELLTALAKGGTAIFISSHILNEIAKMADRIGIIHEGRLIQESDFESLDKLRYKKLRIGVKDVNGAMKLLLKSGYSAKQEDGGIINADNDAALLNPEKAAELLVKAGFPPYMLKVEEEGLEEYFLRIIGMDGKKQ
ncbi:MAG: ABC transporter ATP-binding protein [Candidatus Goldiibacteriota bacterium]